MTCFWNGLIRGLSYEEINKTLSLDNVNPYTFSEALKKHNKRTTSVKWINEHLSEKQLEENYDAIEEYDLSTVNSGYLCSTFDPFIFLVCELFQVNINHRYINTEIKYSVDNSNKILNFVSSRSHFAFKG